MYYEDKEAEAFLRAGVGNAERELDSYAAKLGMKPRDDQSTEYGFGGDDCWYQRSYRK